MLSTVMGVVNLGCPEGVRDSPGEHSKLRVAKSDNQFQCPKCTMSCHHEEIQNLKPCFTDLKSEITNMKLQINALSNPPTIVSNPQPPIANVEQSCGPALVTPIVPFHTC